MDSNSLVTLSVIFCYFFGHYLPNCTRSIHLGLPYPGLIGISQEEGRLQEAYPHLRLYLMYPGSSIGEVLGGRIQ